MTHEPHRTLLCDEKGLPSCLPGEERLTEGRRYAGFLHSPGCQAPGPRPVCQSPEPRGPLSVSFLSFSNCPRFISHKASTFPIRVPLY